MIVFLMLTMIALAMIILFMGLMGWISTSITKGLHK